MSKQLVHKEIHRIRNHLNRISMQSELVKLLISQEAPAEKIAASLSSIVESCEKCNEPLTDLADFANALPEE